MTLSGTGKSKSLPRAAEPAPVVPPVGMAPLSPPPPEDPFYGPSEEELAAVLDDDLDESVIADEPTSAPASEPVLPVASPVLPLLPIHADTTIRGWFADYSNQLIAGGMPAPRVENMLQDLLRRLGLRN